MKIQNLIKRHLILECALKKRFTTYGELILTLNLPFDLAKAQDRKELGQILGKISKEEYSNDLPLLSSLVIDSTKMIPGDGFFQLLGELGFPINAESDKDQKILSSHKEQMKCFKFWRVKLTGKKTNTINELTIYSTIENQIIEWADTGTNTAGKLTRNILNTILE